MLATGRGRVCPGDGRAGIEGKEGMEGPGGGRATATGRRRMENKRRGRTTGTVLQFFTYTIPFSHSFLLFPKHSLAMTHFLFM